MEDTQRTLIEIQDRTATGNTDMCNAVMFGSAAISTITCDLNLPSGEARELKGTQFVN